MKARFTCMAALAVLCASGASAQDTATAGGTTPALTQDTTGTGIPAAPVTTTTTDTAIVAGADTAFAATPVMTEDTAITTTTTASETEPREERGFDWNWLGLLGLLGLAGLFKKRRTEVVHHDTVRPVGRNDPPGTRPRV